AHIEGADQDGTRGLQSLDQRGIALRRLVVCIDLGAGQGWQSGNVEQVLDREWDAGERAQGLAGSSPPVEVASRFDRALRRHRGEGIEGRVAVANSLQRVLDHLAGSEFAAAYSLCDVYRSRPIEFSSHRRGPRIPAPGRYPLAARTARRGPRI